MKISKCKTSWHYEAPEPEPSKFCSMKIEIPGSDSTSAGSATSSSTSSASNEISCGSTKYTLDGDYELYRGPEITFERLMGQNVTHGEGNETTTTFFNRTAIDRLKRLWKHVPFEGSYQHIGQVQRRKQVKIVEGHSHDSGSGDGTGSSTGSGTGSTTGSGTGSSTTPGTRRLGRPDSAHATDVSLFDSLYGEEAGEIARELGHTSPHDRKLAPDPMDGGAGDSAGSDDASNDEANEPFYITSSTQHTFDLDTTAGGEERNKGAESYGGRSPWYNDTTIEEAERYYNQQPAGASIQYGAAGAVNKKIYPSYYNKKDNIMYYYKVFRTPVTNVGYSADCSSDSSVTTCSWGEIKSSDKFPKDEETGRTIDTVVDGAWVFETLVGGKFDLETGGLTDQNLEFLASSGPTVTGGIYYMPTYDSGSGSGNGSSRVLVEESNWDSSDPSSAPSSYGLDSSSPDRRLDSSSDSSSLDSSSPARRLSVDPKLWRQRDQWAFHYVGGEVVDGFKIGHAGVPFTFHPDYKSPGEDGVNAVLSKSFKNKRHGKRWFPETVNSYSILLQIVCATPDSISVFSV
jgi:hypothetical protein